VPSLTLLFNRAREVDRKTANELRDSFQYGTQVNSRNDLLNPMSRNTQRRANTAQKAKALKEENNIVSKLRSKIDDEKNSRKLSITQQRSCLMNFHHCKQLQRSPNKRQSMCGTHAGAYSPCKLEWSSHEYFKNLGESPSSSRPLSGDG
jgi:hypothetical protein